MEKSRRLSKTSSLQCNGGWVKDKKGKISWSCDDCWPGCETKEMLLCTFPLCDCPVPDIAYAGNRRKRFCRKAQSRFSSRD